MGLKDLRLECRLRMLSTEGGVKVLVARLLAHDRIQAAETESTVRGDLGELCSQRATPYVGTISPTANSSAIPQGLAVSATELDHVPSWQLALRHIEVNKPLDDHITAEPWEQSQASSLDSLPGTNKSADSSFFPSQHHGMAGIMSKRTGWHQSLRLPRRLSVR